MDHDQEQQSEVQPLGHREFGSTRFSLWKQADDPAQEGKSDLPLFSTQTSPQPASPEKVVLSATDHRVPDASLRHRDVPMNRATNRSSNRFLLTSHQKTEHENRKDEIKAILSSILDDEYSQSYSILVCWGKQGHCQILPVKIANSADDVAVWRKLRRAWYAHRGVWRSYLPFLRPRVKSVKVLIVGRGSRGTAERTFIGTYTDDDSAAVINRHEKTIAEYVPQKFPCEYNLSTGGTNCGERCKTIHNDFIDPEEEEWVECPERQLYYAKRELARSKVRSRLSLAFSCPNLAAANDLLDAEDVAISEQDILLKLDHWHCPRLGELEFRGLMIDEELDPDSRAVALSLAATVLFVVVFAAKLVFGDWGTAWNVGSFFVALATLAWMWLHCSLG